MIGPLSPKACAQLGPGGERYQELCSVISLLSPETIDLDVELQPSAGSMSRLGRKHGTRLGLNTWLGSRGSPTPVRFRANTQSPPSWT